MSNQSKGRKISNFTAQSSIPANAELTYISGNTNYRISLADFLASIGVTGTIEQDGDVSGTPVLNISGAVNQIRNLEDGSGVKASVSPSNGITLEHNFITDTVGTQLVVDLTAAQPKFRSLVAGDGINISRSNGNIQIALSSIPVSTKTVIINSISDFPAAISGVITLDDNTEYAIRNDIITANRFVLGDNCVLSGSDASVVSITYTGASDMFTSASKTWKVKSLTINCTSGSLLSFTGTGVEILQFIECILNADTGGSISDFIGLYIDSSQINITTNGFTFGGSNGVMLDAASLISIDAGTVYDLGAATFAAFSTTDCFTTLNGTSVFLDGAASSANIDVGGLGSVHNCRFFGTGTPLQTIASDDLRWQFLINDDIIDTHRDCLLSLVANATPTTITAVNTPALVAGTWNIEHFSQFTGTTAGRCTYNGTNTIHVDVTISISAAPVTGSNKTIGFYIAKNGSVISNSEGKSVISAGDLARTTIIWRSVLTTGDYIEAYVENETDAVDVLVTDAVIRVG